MECQLPQIELKLSAAPHHIPELKQVLEFLGSSSVRPPVLISSTYYDTPGLKLRRHGLSFRLSGEEDRWVQTLESNDFISGNFLSRDEWEDVIATNSPDPAASETGPRLHDVVDVEDLRPLFRTVVQRTVVELELPSTARIEIAIEEGDIRGAEVEISAPFCEIELASKSGDPAAVYEVALRLLKVAPLRIETLSTSDRGYRLIAPEGGRAAAIQAIPVALNAAMTVEAALQNIGRACIGQLLRNEPAVLASQPEGIHQMRVAARRLRAALSALKPMIPAAQYQWALSELKWLAGTLGPARNWDVFAAHLLEPVERALSVEKDLKRLAEAAEQRRRMAHERARAAVESPRYTSTMLSLARWFEARGWRDQPASAQAALLFATIGDVAPGLIERCWRRTRKRSRQFGELSLEQRHKLRISLKKLRYTIEFLRDLFDTGEVRALERRLKPLQEDLGRLNDVRTAHALVDEVSRHVNEGGSEIGCAGGIVLGWHVRGLSDEEPKLRKDVRRLRQAKRFWPRDEPAPKAQAEPPPAQLRNTADNSEGRSAA